MLDINKPQYELLDSYTCSLLDPKTLKEIDGVTLELIAPRLPEFKKSRKLEEEKAEEGEDTRLAIVVAGIKSWTGFTDKGKDAPCNSDAKRAFFGDKRNASYLAQVFAVLQSNGTFLASASES